MYLIPLQVLRISNEIWIAIGSWQSKITAEFVLHKDAAKKSEIGIARYKVWNEEKC